MLERPDKGFGHPAHDIKARLSGAIMKVKNLDIPPDKM
jgi:hypothetical protein